MKTPLSSLSSDRIDSFKKLLSDNAKTLQEGEQGYDEAILRWSDYAVKKAGMIVQVANLQDIIETVKFARENDLDFAVHGGGHNCSGASSSEGGIVLDMKKLCNVRADPEKKLVYVQGGARWSDVNQETHKYGLACVGPNIDSVGVGGFTLGGGYGFLTGQYGLSIDNLVAATIVLADGNVKELSATSNPDLFWAIRGCGFNFGVVYEFVIKAYEHPNDVHSGVLMFPGEKVDKIYETVKELVGNAKGDEYIIVGFTRMPPEFQPTVYVVLFLDSPSSEEFRSRFSTLYSLQPISDTCKTMTYSESTHCHTDNHGYGYRKLGLTVHSNNFFTNSSMKNAWQSVIDFTDPTKELGNFFTQSAVQFNFYSTEGMNKIGNDETLFHYRGQKMNGVYIFVKWNDDKYDKEAFKWLYQTREMFLNDTTNHIMLANCNTPPKEDMKKFFDQELEIAFGKENLEKLKELKRKYDPTCFFNKWLTIKS